MAAQRRPARSRRPRRCSMRRPTPSVAYDRRGRRARRSRTPAGQKLDDGWHLPNAKTAARRSRCSARRRTSNPGLFAAARPWSADWKAHRAPGRRTSPLPPGEFVTRPAGDRRRSRSPSPTCTIGLDPDLYPLLASSQTLTGGSNVIGLQDPALDALLVKAARARARRPSARPAYSALQKQLAKGRYLLPLAFADEVVVVRDTLEGPGLRQVTGPVGSILGCANMAPRRRPVAGRSRSVPRWRNGRRAGFRNQWPQGRVGSSPSLGTIPSRTR